MGKDKTKNDDKDAGKDKDKKNKSNKNEADVEITEVDLLMQQLDEQVKLCDEYKDKFLRAQADFDNFKKRSAKERINIVKFANEDIILELLEVVDNFERAMSSIDQVHDTSSIKDGVSMVYKQLMNVLTQKGLTKIEALNKEFDPNHHEAIAAVESNLEENTIVEVVIEGYMLNDKVVRPSKVIVAKATQCAG
ncbi:MAG: nucleotide exchange factor GrpE [Methanosarcinales archaeon]|nr:nucleotide exchange factor GrpE [Methanosarcinales archaeon]